MIRHYLPHGPAFYRRHRTIGATSLRILAIILDRKSQAERPPSLLEMAVSLGSSVNNIKINLNRLRRVGLIQNEFTNVPCRRHYSHIAPDHDKVMAQRTLRSTVRFVPADQLEASR